MRRCLALLLVLALGAGNLTALAATSLKTLNVRAADVSHAATLFAEDLLTPAAAAKADKEPPATYARLGVVSNDARLIMVTTNTLVLAELYQMRTTAGATAFYALEESKAAAAKGTVAMRTGTIGDQRRAGIGPSNLGAQQVPGSFVLFRRGVYVALVAVAGTSRTFPAAEAARIATLLDGRLQHAR